MRLNRFAPIAGAVLIAGTALAAIPGSAFAQTTITGFTNFTTNGSASATSSTLFLTANGPHETGSGFYNQKVDLAGSWEVSFSETSSNSSTSATFPDGFAFVVQNDFRGAYALGGPGGYLGYGLNPNYSSYAAITPSAIVEFDNAQNGAPINDPSSPPYAAFMENGNADTHYAYGSYAFNGTPPTGPATEYFWIDYNGTTGQWSVYENTTSDKGTANLLFTYTDPISTQLGSSLGYLGFTGGTGAGYSQQVINNFTFSSVENAGAFTVPNGQTAYDIESSNFYCTTGGTACVPGGGTYSAEDCFNGNTTCPAGVNYADVEAFGPPNGATNGTPDQLILVCAQSTSFGYNIGYVDVVSSTGNTDYGGTTMDPFTGVYGNSNIGTISAKGTVFNDPTNGTGSEDNPAQTSSVNGSAYDPFTYDETNVYTIGSVTGTQNTNNSSDTLNSGQFRITIRGTLYHAYTTGSITGETYNGTISCTAGGTHANDLANAGLTATTSNLAEGEVEPVIGDNTFYPSTLAGSY